MTPEDEMHVALLRKAYGRPLATLTERQEAALQLFLRDVWAAARTEGEKARHGAATAIRARVVSRRTRAIDLAIELLASVATLAGAWLGSTTLHGVECYLVSTAAWCAISWRKSLRGIWPLNIGMLLVMLSNLWAVLA